MDEGLNDAMQQPLHNYSHMLERNPRLQDVLMQLFLLDHPDFHDFKLVLVRFWAMHRWTPFVQHFPQRHLGSTIALKLDSMLETLELTDPEVLKFCVNDNASNMP